MDFLTKVLAIVLFFCAGVIGSCKPRIYSFRPTPETSSGRDSIRLDWKVKGTASVQFSQRRIAQPPNDSVDVLEFKLIVHKGKVDSFQTILVPVVGDLTRDFIVLDVGRLDGDTAVATGVKDIGRWKGYVVNQLSGMAGRILIVTHAGISGVVRETALSDAWSGKPYSGVWEIRSPLTNKEAKDHSTVPDSLTVSVIVNSPKK
jgi:hypothetical protein